MNVFYYNHLQDYEGNFRRWEDMSRVEREGFNLKPYSIKKAKAVFDRQYSKYKLVIATDKGESSNA
tara:strand:- start:1897 stop:2094 length:198 start_codon:yes stop_codon:yes gene_type:complete